MKSKRDELIDNAVDKVLASQSMETILRLIAVSLTSETGRIQDQSIGSAVVTLVTREIEDQSFSKVEHHRYG